MVLAAERIQVGPDQVDRQVRVGTGDGLELSHSRKLPGHCGVHFVDHGPEPRVIADRLERGILLQVEPPLECPSPVDRCAQRGKCRFSLAPDGVNARPENAVMGDFTGRKGVQKGQAAFEQPVRFFRLAQSLKQHGHVDRRGIVVGHPGIVGQQVRVHAFVSRQRHGHVAPAQVVQQQGAGGDRDSVPFKHQ
jgi:hypothetical protein